MGYLGCGTKLNKILWGCFTALCLLGAILLAVGGAKLAPCRRGLDACKLQTGTPHPPADHVCFTRFRACARSHVITGVVGLLCIAAALMLTCGMCCCAPPPMAGSDPAGLQMAHPAYPAAAAPYGGQQPGYGGAAAPSDAYYGHPQQPYQQQQQPYYQQQPYGAQQQPAGYPPAPAPGQPYPPPAGGQQPPPPGGVPIYHA